MKKSFWKKLKEVITNKSCGGWDCAECPFAGFSCWTMIMNLCENLDEAKSLDEKTKAEHQKNLKTLEDVNKEAFERHTSYTQKSFQNGIACPNCKNELYEDGGVQTLSFPPQVPIFCKHCQYKGWRVL